MEINEFIELFRTELKISEFTVLTGDTNFKQIEEWGSMSMVSLIVLVEENFGKDITPMDVRKCNSIYDLYELVKI